MKALELFFWIALFVIFYSYLGYGIVLFAIIKIRRLLGLGKPFQGNEDYLPEVTLFVAAYNEKDYLDEKVANSRSLNYPKEKVVVKVLQLKKKVTLQLVFLVNLQ